MGDQKQRKLSKAEQARHEQLERTIAELEAQGYKTADLTVEAAYANIMALVLSLPIIILLGVIFVLTNSGTSLWLGGIGLIPFLLIFMILIVIHELIHGITWSLFTKEHWKSISFGFIPKYAMPYCTCNEPLRRGQYIAGAMMPTLVLGLLPAIIAMILGSGMLFAVSALMIISGGGDLTIILKLLRFREASRDTIYIDHPYLCGLLAFSR